MDRTRKKRCRAVSRLALPVTLAGALAAAGCGHQPAPPSAAAAPTSARSTATAPDTQSRPRRAAAPSPLVTAARKQVGKTIMYDPAYASLNYPGGDIPIERGVCTDVAIRALRDALDLDLQRVIHEDMRQAFKAYPDLWGLKKPDRNIDHRRVPNVRCYFQRKGYALPVSRSANDYRPGDFVTCTVAGNRPHIMIVSDRRSPDRTPLVIHNIGRGAREEDSLFKYPITGHYRVPQNMKQTAE